MKKETKLRKSLKYSLILLTVLTVFSSLIQFFLYPDLRNLIYLGWDPHLRRLFGVFFDTSTAGAIFGLMFLTLLLQKDFVKNRLIKLVLLSFYFIFVVLTYSRSLYFVFIGVLVWYMISGRLAKYIPLFIITFFLLLILIPREFRAGVPITRIFSIESRLIDYQNGLKIWSKSPIFGIGYNRIRYVIRNEEVASHSAASFSSSFLIILVTAGIIGLILFLATLFKTFLLNKIIAYYILFAGTVSLADNIILHPFIIFLLGMLIIYSRFNPSGR